MQAPALLQVGTAAPTGDAPGMCGLIQFLPDCSADSSGGMQVWGGGGQAGLEGRRKEMELPQEELKLSSLWGIPTVGTMVPVHLHPLLQSP